TASFTITATDSIGCAGSSASYAVNIIAACLFCDEFDDGVLNPNWTYIKDMSDWSEDGSNLIGKNLAKKTTAYANPAFLNAPAACTTCYAETAMSTAGGQFNRVWFFFNAQDPKLNLVELMMKEESNRWILKQRINKKIVAKAKFVSTIDPNVFYTARIRYDGTNFIASIDGVDVITLAPVGPVTGGSVGFKVKRTTGTFQYIHVN
ncbi:MAG TPA: hypothetical protein VLR94_02685, partial [Acidobacteriota bacterium]|nr:hypothetical protein [Acidobacteriota bacterium]